MKLMPRPPYLQRANTLGMRIWRREWGESLQESAVTEQQRELARQIVEELKAAAEFPLGELIMPPHRSPIDDEEVEDKTLVVVTMPGLSPPPEAVEREYW